MSLIGDLMTAAVAAINAKTDYAIPGLVAVKDYSLAIENEQHEGIRVTVTPAGEANSAEPSTLEGYEAQLLTVAVVVSAHVKTPSDETEIENLFNLVEAIRTQVKTIAAISFMLQSWESSPPYDVELLRSGFFRSITTFTFQHPAY